LVSKEKFTHMSAQFSAYTGPNYTYPSKPTICAARSVAMCQVDNNGTTHGCYIQHVYGYLSAQHSSTAP
jgi:hypothetical protein